MDRTIEIRLYKVVNAGMFEIRASDLGGHADMVLDMNCGSPFKLAHRDAERLAVILNCDLYLDDELIRARMGD